MSGVKEWLVSRFSDEQQKKLDEKLDRTAISTRKQGNTQLAYIEGWWAIQQANRIFGYDGWETEITHINLGAPTEYAGKSGPMFSVTAWCTLRTTVKGKSHEDVGFGSGFCSAKMGPGDAIEGALKEAVTDAEKRCLRHWGDQFGLALYDKEKRGVKTREEQEAESVDATKSEAQNEPTDGAAAESTESAPTEASADPAKVAPERAKKAKTRFVKVMGEEFSRVGRRRLQEVLLEHGYSDVTQVEVQTEAQLATLGQIVEQSKKLPNWDSDEGMKAYLSIYETLLGGSEEAVEQMDHLFADMCPDGLEGATLDNRKALIDALEEAVRQKLTAAGS